MFPKSKSGKLALYVLSGALTSAVAAGPAMAVGSGEDHRRPYKGKVIAKTGLLKRSGPSTKYKVIGSNPYGKIVKIKCKVNGENIKGNPRWYKLKDGSYAWSSARYIMNIGEAPDWC
ncbi:SH3 domain-containing protein [Streptomyces piniterrae]|uniref:SH3 domain-containing protein n=1 Tax=Streptomyces piniterrae TaxID=2571125 RepID=A0A4V5MIN4_9ACTN|nr:SH3 domain-containing protein [Streptomyces piniterrae]TJZ45998.1 SH3 domain-containing protein [Streptomyces piniterrae]